MSDPRGTQGGPVPLRSRVFVESLRSEPQKMSQEDEYEARANLGPFLLTEA